MRGSAGGRVLHKTSRMQGYHIVATDGPIGHVDDFLLDERTWALRYLVVDTGNWIGGKSVLISSAMIESIDSPAEKIRVKLSRDQVEQSPSVDTAEIELVETLPSVFII